MSQITAIICDELIDNQRYQFATALVKPIVLVGSPGSGKSHYLQRLADLNIRAQANALSWRYEQ
jgi:chromosomal replication initiation ATPase DnaA